MLKRLFVSVKILWYSILDYLYSDPPSVQDSDVRETKVQQRENSKLARGVKSLVERLRSMHPSVRGQVENLLGQSKRVKTPQEKLEELRIVEKMINNPPIKTEDDLVKAVVKKAPIYAKEQELSKLRKELTRLIKLSASNPNDKGLADKVKEVNRNILLTKREIINMKAQL